MIRPPGFRGAAFTTSRDGDARSAVGKDAICRQLGICGDWATVRQVHGEAIRVATYPGDLGDGDGIATLNIGLPIATFTADCFGMVLETDSSVGVVHAGWRGAAAGVVRSAVMVLRDLGEPIIRAAVGPGIQACCFEVGDEVPEALGGFAAKTSWGSASVDLREAVLSQLGDVDVWASDECTRCGDGFFSHRGTGTSRRMATLGWLP